MQPQTPPPVTKPNAAATWITSKSGIPTWGLILAILLACGFGFLVHPGSTSTVTTTANVAATHVPTHPVGTPLPTAGPVTVASFTGSTSKNTATFTVAASQWTLTWTCQGSGNFIVAVDNADGSSFDPGAVNQICTDSQMGDSTIERQSGDFYLSIIADVNWTITITATQ